MAVPATEPSISTCTWMGPDWSGSITQPATRTFPGPIQACSKFPNGEPERTSTVRLASTWLAPAPTFNATALTVCTPAPAGTVAL